VESKGHIAAGASSAERPTDVGAEAIDMLSHRDELPKSEADIDRRIVELGHSISLNPKNGTAYRDRAFLYARKRELERAMHDLGRALLFDPKDAQAYESAVRFCF
jgi:regulator of sirC expression with transglutaminase-like and TPR domain